MAAHRIDPVDKHVGSRIRMRRLMLDMSQEALANQLGLTFQQVQKYEKGTNRVSASRLQHISTILQIPVPFFFEGVPRALGDKKQDDTFPEYVSEFLATADGLALVKAFVSMKSATLRRSIVQLVKEMSEQLKRQSR